MNLRFISARQHYSIIICSAR